MQAKDVPEADVLAAIDACLSKSGSGTTAPTWAIQEAMPLVPPKVVLARLRSMLRRGVIDAQCDCGCRGDWCRPEGSPWGNHYRKAKGEPATRKP